MSITHHLQWEVQWDKRHQKGKVRQSNKTNVNATEPPSNIVRDTKNKKLALMNKLIQLKAEENILNQENMEFEAMLFICQALLG